MAEPTWAAATLGRMESATGAFREQVEARRHDPDSVLQAIREFEACLEELGVVPSPLARIFRRIEAAGGAAKVSGAGTLSGRGLQGGDPKAPRCQPRLSQKMASGDTAVGSFRS